MSTPHAPPLDGGRPLRLTTWLAPSIPLGFYHRLATALEGRLGQPVRVSARYDCSGPAPGSSDPFWQGEVDLGFVCAPSYRALAAVPRPSVRLLGAAPVFDDPRNGGRPKYFCDVVVRRDDPARSLSDLRARRFGYNDRMSLSGWWGIHERLAEQGETPGDFFSDLVQTGSHPASLEALDRGEIDVATIDSTLLTLVARGCHPTVRSARHRVLDSIGPCPVQPAVVRADLSARTTEVIRQTLLSVGPWPEFALRSFGEQTEACIGPVRRGTQPPTHYAHAG